MAPMLSLSLLVAGLSAQEASAPVQQLIEKLQAREASLKSLSLEMSTVGAYPDKTKVSTQGRLRVLGKTHFHILVHAEMESMGGSQVETVVTPEGVWTGEKGPLGEVYLKMESATMHKLKEAVQALGRQEEFPGSMARAEAPLGSGMLQALQAQFDLQVQEQVKPVGSEPFPKTECIVIKGKARAKAEDFGGGGATAAAEVEIMLRAGDFIPISMLQFNSLGEEMLRLTISKLKLDIGLDEASFKLNKPESVPFKDVMSHPPSQLQIQQILHDYAELQRAEKEKEKEKEKDEEQEEESEPGENAKSAEEGSK